MSAIAKLGPAEWIKARDMCDGLSPPVTDAPVRPVIQLIGGQLHAYAAEAERMLADEVYERGSQLVRIGKAPELQSNGINRDAEQAVIVPVGQEYLRRKLTERFEFQTFRRREREWVAVDCPRDLAANIAHAGDWPEFQTLTGIATAPFLRPDHSLCDKPGYDAASRVFLAPNASFPQIARKPTKVDAEQALDELAAPFAEFPFASLDAKAAFLSHILTSAARHALDATPAVIYTAPLAGTGKSLLSGMASRIEHGTPPAMRPFPDGDDELRKSLLGSLLAGDTTLILDNIPNGQRVRSPILCSFITSTVYQDRRLGSSENPRLPNRCTVVATGNNITPTGDLARRCIIVRLDANSESVRARDFQIRDIAAHVALHRPNLLAAALTVIRAYVTAGYPDVGRPLPSFETWSRLVRDPLLWLGYADAAATQEQEADDEIAPLRAAFASLDSWVAGKEFAARDIARACDGYAENKVLREVIEAAGCGDASDARKVGYWLRDCRDRVAGELKLRSCAQQHGISRWKLEAV